MKIMKRLVSIFAFSILSTIFMPLAENAASAASPASTLITCTDLNSQKTVVLRANQNLCKPFHAPAVWRIQQSDSTAHTGTGYSNMRICSSKRPLVNYKFIRTKCNKYHEVTDYWRSTSVPLTPVITSASARGHENAVFILASSGSATNLDAPIAYYLVTNIKTGQASKIVPNRLDQLTISNLNAMTSYTFTIAAVSVDGTSGSSAITPVITTGAVPVVVVAPAASQLAAPAFTLSSSSETKTVNTTATGFTISSTGGAIASFAISSTPPGMSFSTSTGALTGTPTTVASATAYTITATNSTGSAIRTFTLTVTGIVYTVGSTGPGGGKIFYFSADGFTCGDSYSSTCTYLEVGPSVSVRRDNWSNTALQNTSTLNSTGTAIGTGHRNTAVVVAAGAIESTTSAIAYTDQYVAPNGTNDWFLPSTGEMTALYNAASASGVSLISGSDYWTSSQHATTANKVLQLRTTAGSIIEDYKPNRGALIAPIRAG
jgi:hypothetical protein